VKKKLYFSMMFSRMLTHKVNTPAFRRAMSAGIDPAVGKAFVMATGIATGLGIFGGLVWKFTVAGPCRNRIDAYYATQK
tara:strand:- start:7 stop:243 length:237 start_codon:yes stop_codon:yes gene_type:complete